MGDDTAAIRLDDSHHNADGLLLMFDAPYEDFADSVGAGNGKRPESIRIHKIENRLQLCSNSGPKAGGGDTPRLACRMLIRGMA